MNKEHHKEIIILGGGFGGIAAAKELLRFLESQWKVTLVDRNRYQVFHPTLYELATASITQEPVTRFEFEELIEGMTISYEDIFPGSNQFRFIKGEVKDIHLQNKLVHIADGRVLPFHYLVIALGSETNFFGIPGLAMTALPLKTAFDAVNIRNAIYEVFRRKQPNQRITILIGGGGFTGCEFAGELSHALDKLCVQYPHWRDRVEIIIVEASAMLLPGAKSWIQEEMKLILQKRGVTILFSDSVQALEDHNAILKSGKRIFFDILVWAAGVKGNSLIEQISAVTLEKGCKILVNAYLQVVPHEYIFAIGDNIHCFDKSRGVLIPPTAQGAIVQGRHVAKNIVCHIQGRKLLTYRFGWPTFVIPTGGKNALCDLFNLRMKGKFAWLLHELAFLRYFLMILPWRKALSFWVHGLQLFTKND